MADKQVKLGKTGEINLPSVDITPHLGKKVVIESVTEHEGEFGYYIKVSTPAFETFKNSEGEEVEVRASRIFGLQRDAEGNIGWGKETKLGAFLKKMKVKHYKDLVGKEVMTQSITSTKDAKDYLTFN